MTPLSEARILATARVRAAWQTYRMAQRLTPSLVPTQRRRVKAAIHTLRIIRRAERAKHG